MLLDRLLRPHPGQPLDVGRDRHRLDLAEGDAAFFTPREELSDGATCDSRVLAFLMLAVKNSTKHWPPSALRG